jgi:hypothetical protein
MLMNEGPDIAAAIVASQREALEYIVAKRLSGDQIISINQQTVERRNATGAPIHSCFITIWFDPERGQ